MSCRFVDILVRASHAILPFPQPVVQCFINSHDWHINDLLIDTSIQQYEHPAFVLKRPISDAQNPKVEKGI